MLNELSKQVHENAKSKGFFDSEKNIGEMLCLIHSEVSEALEADRKNFYTNVSEIKLKGLADKNYGATFNDDEIFKEFFSITVKNTFEDELADVIIRVLDLCAFKGIDIEKHIKMKMRYNALREHKHGKAY
jgi:NTP pyrophosphatase (non-canonical NTP hydrolase)